ncbi:Transcriptional regulator PadR-like family protein [Catalinimonas alkaloidigena]|uniref:Transcriptional regulator PadR-like family protein n=1 Tax=Catalinimonas alkaloidigena TaxID=1075417 RepID=A0A1G9GA61_9BACT|nr:helix-turn-helix transcriptional regulator [Catalinimonas alkaloidigena]SDK97598.1 Transcriptional regulator PadR-like family protein [Catalinimonas alkaloidigena]
MKGTYLGEFEELVLLTVAVLYEEAYGIAIKKEMEERLERSVSVGALQSALARMEKKSYLSSRLGDATPERGGKRKRYYTVTPAGYKVLRETKETRLQLWNAIPRLAFDFSQ